jgi:hypothetical protein
MDQPGVDRAIGMDGRWKERLRGFAAVSSAKLDAAELEDALVATREGIRVPKKAMLAALASERRHDYPTARPEVRSLSSMPREATSAAAGQFSKFIPAPRNLYLKPGSTPRNVRGNDGMTARKRNENVRISAGLAGAMER